MKQNKETIILSKSQFEDQQAYVKICSEIQMLEKIRSELKDRMLSTLSPIFDPEKNFDAGMVTFSARRVSALNQVKTFELFSKASNRRTLFPNAVEFKPGKDKAMAERFDLLEYEWSAPIVTINRF